MSKIYHNHNNSLPDNKDEVDDSMPWKIISGIIIIILIGCIINVIS